MKNLLYISLILLSAAAMLACVNWASKIDGDALACVPTLLAIPIVGGFAWLVTHLPKRRTRA